MSKRPRRNRPPRRQDPSTRPAPPPDPAGFAAGDATPVSDSGSGAAAPVPSTGGRTPASTRPARPTRRTTRTTRRVEPRKGFVERYRGALLGVLALIGVGLIGYVFLTSATASAYSCATLMTPGPEESAPTPAPTFRATPTADASASPSGSAGASPSASTSASPGASPGPSAGPSASPSASPGATQRVGFAAADLGAIHVPPGSPLKYAYCPPTSGNHYNGPGQGPIRRDFYDAGSERTPGGWVHNLEHGWVVLAYRGGEGQAPSEEVLAQLRTFYDTAPPSDVAGPCQSPNKLLVVRYDEMKTPFAMLAWGRALMMETFDPEKALAFYEQWVDDEGRSEMGLC